MKVAVLLFLSLTPTYAALAEDDARPGQEDDIREAVFRHQIKKSRANIYFLNIDTGEKDAPVDPSAEFLKRFSDIKATIRKDSGIKRDGGLQVIDAVSGKPGIQLIVGKITWVSDKEVSVEGFVITGGLSGAGYTHTLKKSNDGWSVTASLRGGGA